MRETEATRDGTVKIGGASLLRSEAFSAAEKYLSGHGGYAYPAYDAYDSGSNPDRVSDADFLAPVLLNVTPSITAYYSLQGLRTQLNEWLAEVPTDANLESATDAELEHLGALFAILDSNPKGVGGTTLAKIMHRKRPSFVPLYDRFVWQTYVAAPSASVARDTKRTWSDFIRLLAHEMQGDLRREGEWLDSIAATASGPPITRLRVLDIVAWEAGKKLAAANPASDGLPLEEDA